MVSINQAAIMTAYWRAKSKKPVFWWGPPGVGKSQKIHQIARTEIKNKENKPGGLVDFRANLRDPVDLRGYPVINVKKSTAEWYSPDELPQVDRDGERGIFFMDELNTANAQMQAACFGLVLDRKVGNYKLPDGWVIMAAGNRQEDRSAAQRMPRALANRFAHFDITIDHKAWIEDYALENCHPMVVGFIRWKPDALFNMSLTSKGNDGKEVVHDERAFPTPRSWEGVSDICDAPDELRFGLVKSCVGDIAAGEFEAFVKTYKDLPDLDDIFNHPTTTEVPTEPSALYAISSALSRFSNRDNFDAAATYAKRLGREYEIIVVLDSTKRDVELTRTQTYKKFVTNNKDIQIGQFRVN